MVLARLEANPVELFYGDGRPYIYSGTTQKVAKLGEYVKRFGIESREKKWGQDLYFAIPDNIRPQQVAVPKVPEPNQFIAQHSLIEGKAMNQVYALQVALGISSKRRHSNEYKIPRSLEKSAKAGEPVALLMTDVGVRQCEDGGKWDPSRNFLLKNGAKHPNVDSLRAQIIGYYASVYGEYSDNVEWQRAFDSSIALTVALFGEDEMPYVQVYPACSTVGVIFESHPLRNKALRHGYIDYLFEQYGDNTNAEKIARLESFDGVAGGVRIEDLIGYARSLSIFVNILADAEKQTTSEDELINHAKGASYPLLVSLLLTLLHHDQELLQRRTTEGFLIQQYPKGADARRILRV